MSVSSTACSGVTPSGQGPRCPPPARPWPRPAPPGSSGVVPKWPCPRPGRRRVALPARAAPPAAHDARDEHPVAGLEGPHVGTHLQRRARWSRGRGGRPGPGRRRGRGGGPSRRWPCAPPPPRHRRGRGAGGRPVLDGHLPLSGEDDGADRPNATPQGPPSAGARVAPAFSGGAGRVRRRSAACGGTSAPASAGAGA